MSTDGIWHTHLYDINHLCVHIQQNGLPTVGVVTRAQLESAAMRYNQANSNTRIVIGDLWLTLDDIRNLLVEGWGTP